MDRSPKLKDLSTAVIADCMGRFGAMHGRIRRLSGSGLAGPAFTVEVAAGENRTIHLAIEQAPAGSVLVVDAEGHLGRAVWGDVMTAAAIASGIAGLVVDGAIRDLGAIRERDFPVYASGVTPAGPHKGWPGRIGLPVAVGDVCIATGDLVVGDLDGVAVVPSGEIDRVLEAAHERNALEARWMRRIEEGEPSPDVLKLR